MPKGKGKGSSRKKLKTDKGKAFIPKSVLLIELEAGLLKPGSKREGKKP
jgi:hypothetical protein